MTVEADIFNLLKAVTPRVFPDVAPTSTVRPYVTYQQVGGEVVTYLGREVPSKKNGRFQVNVWADTRAQASSLALAIESAFILSTAMQAEPSGAHVGTYDEDMELYGTMQFFSVWSNR